MTDSFKIIQSVMAQMIAGYELPIDVFRDLMIYFTSGSADDSEIAGFLKIFSQYPLRPDYLLTAIDVLQSQMIEVKIPSNLCAIDCCGTGGDKLDGLNISTAVAFMLADYGVYVAKHGNRSITSQSGSADVLEAIGYPISDNPYKIAQTLEKTKLCFMFAPYFHPTLRHVALARQSVGIRTFFNLLGPLLNPARVRRQLIGIYDFGLAPVIAQTLLQLGCERAIIVTSSEGADELTLSGINQICYIKDGDYTLSTFDPQETQLSLCSFDAIKGKDVSFNSKALLSVLNKTPSPYYDTVILNAAAGLWVADHVTTISEGVRILQANKNPIDLAKFLAH